MPTDGSGVVYTAITKEAHSILVTSKSFSALNGWSYITHGSYFTNNTLSDITVSRCDIVSRGRIFANYKEPGVADSVTVKSGTTEYLMLSWQFNEPASVVLDINISYNWHVLAGDSIHIITISMVRK